MIWINFLCKSQKIEKLQQLLVMALNAYKDLKAIVQQSPSKINIINVMNLNFRHTIFRYRNHLRLTFNLLGCCVVMQMNQGHQR